MNAVTAWAAMLCAAALGCTAVQMLAPPGGMGKIFRLITSAFFLCCMAAPLLSMKSMLTLDTSALPREVASGELEERVLRQFEAQVNAALRQTAEQTLSNYNIPVAKVETIMDTGDDGSIYISSVVLYLDKQNREYAATAKQVMEQRLGVPVTVRLLQE